VALDESRARVTEAQARASFAKRQAEARRSLREKHLVSEEDFRQAQAGGDANHATVAALQLGTARLAHETEVETLNRTARIAKLERKLAELQGKALIEKQTIKRLEHDIALRLIVAPVAGRLGRIEPLRIGTVLHASTVVGAVIPVGSPRAVVFFPVAKIGKMRPGQRAQLRLDNFPWTQYGILQATVASVGNDPLEGRVRVELTLHGDSAPTIPLEHGLSGTAEVEVERAAPAELLLRAIGRLLTTRAYE
jgi:multidrug resistance efflux pump